MLLVVASCTTPENTPGQTGAAGAGGSVMVTGSAGTAGTTVQGAGGASTSGAAGALSSFTAVTCDKTSTTTSTITYTSGSPAPSTSKITTYYADVPVSGLNPTAPPAVRTLLCSADLMTTSASPPTTYTVTSTHTGDVDLSSQNACYEATALFVTGHVYVNCGSTTYDTTGAISGSSKYSRVYVSM
jgi:hypothetical protein